MKENLTYTEENYLKAVLKICLEENKKEVGTNELAKHLSVSPATTNNMLKKLKEKKWVNYEKYGKIKLTKKGELLSIRVIRKHRLWETFLYQKLNFSWDEIHELAEQLEHINSDKLIDRLDQYLEFPEYDPHGDPIPNFMGELKKQSTQSIHSKKEGDQCIVVAVKDDSPLFLKYIAKLGIKIGDKLLIISKIDYDQSIIIELNALRMSITHKVAEKILVD